MEHTPGPWKTVDFATGEKGCVAVVTDEAVPAHICDVFPWGARPGGSSRPLAQHLANGRLIAAAPDLLLALKACALMVDVGAAPPDWDWIREVIAKAEGAPASAARREAV